MPDPQRCPHCAGTGFLPYISELEAQAVRVHKRYLDAQDAEEPDIELDANVPIIPTKPRSSRYIEWVQARANSLRDL